jgi:hypothetical protein
MFLRTRALRRGPSQTPDIVCPTPRPEFMIRSSEAESHYRHTLREAGFSEQRPDALLAWRVFREFAEVPVECSEDALLFQSGVYDFTGRDLFHFGFVRQFTFEEDGEYDHMEQLDCSLLFEPDAELQKLETNLWSYDFDSAEKFFAAVEALPGFSLPLRGRTPVGMELFHSEV